MWDITTAIERASKSPGNEMFFNFFIIEVALSS